MRNLNRFQCRRRPRPVARAASPPPAKPETPTMEVQNLDDDAILAKKREKAVEMVADELLGGFLSRTPAERRAATRTS